MPQHSDDIDASGKIRGFYSGVSRPSGEQPSRLRELTGHVIVRPPEATEMCGISAVHMRRLVARGDFPTPVQLGKRSVGWRLMDLEAWIDARRRPASKDAA